MKEVWEVVEGFETYMISSHGVIFSKKSGKTLKPTVTKKNYLVIQLSKEGKKTNCRVHRLVAKAFIPNPDNLPEVDHRDCNRQNNKVSNLRWATGSQNTRNRAICRQSSSIYNGVKLQERTGNWEVALYFKGKTTYVGTFTDERRAAKAFNQFCIDNKLNRELNIIVEA